MTRWWDVTSHPIRSDSESHASLMQTREHGQLIRSTSVLQAQIHLATRLKTLPIISIQRGFGNQRQAMLDWGVEKVMDCKGSARSV